ncbi:hypothetical protein F4781DRAFT_380359 [Annulohypoxylon bovei var. microspora]|nr:hypothetical protein F4781DRAFT_380359 [Annulohypoxylon bovei var. microspora]
MNSHCIILLTQIFAFAFRSASSNYMCTYPCMQSLVHCNFVNSRIQCCSNQPYCIQIFLFHIRDIESSYLKIH